MMKVIQSIFLFALFSILLTGIATAQNPVSYRIFTGKGVEVSMDKMIDDVAKKEVIFFGEQHNCPIAHWFESLILQALYERKKDLTLGMEMFEADVQPIINEFMQSLISEDSFLAEARPWDNYNTDYMALVDFAKDNKIPLIATNAPRRYASMVHHKGLAMLQKLSPEALRYLAPLPIVPEGSSEEFFNAMLAMAGSEDKEDKVQRLQAAQSVKDATMAHFIIKNKRQGIPFLHINGSYHTLNNGGIIYYLKKMNSTLSFSTISTVRQEQIETLEEVFWDTTDFVIVVSETFPRSY